MDYLIDIYVRILTAVTTLLVPILIFYTNLVSEARKVKEAKYETDIKELQKNSQLDNNDPNKFTKQVGELNEKINRLKISQARHKNLLNPKRQLLRIYSTLLSSFFFILVDIVIREKILPIYSHLFSCTLILISLILFIITFFRILNVTIVAIESKEEIGQ